MEWSLYDDRHELKLHNLEFPAEVKNRHRQSITVRNADEFLNHVDCDERFNTVRNILASRLSGDKTPNPESLISAQSKHILNLYAAQRRFGMCYLFPTVAECPVGIQICFDVIASAVESEERKRLKPKSQDNGNRTPRTNHKAKH